MADPVVHLTNGLPDSGTGNITTLGQTLLDGANATHGVTTGAAVVTDAAGTLQQYLRGLVALAAGGLKAGAAIIGAVTQSGTWTVQPGNTANTTPWLTKIHDGTTAALVKAASTGAPAASDPALVVTIRDVNANGSAISSLSAPVVIASDQSPVAVKGNTVVQAASSTITRPANTTAYASGQLVANSVTAGSVANLQFTTLARVSGGSGVIVGAQIQKSSNVVTNAAFRLHLFNTAPTYVTSGDGSALSTVVVASAKGYLGYIDIPAMVGFSDVAWGSGAPDNSRGSIPYVATAQIIYGLVEARGAYTPVSAEVFTISLDALQD